METDVRVKRSGDALQASLSGASGDAPAPAEQCLVCREDLQRVLEHVSAMECRMAELERRLAELKDYALHWPSCGIGFGMTCDCGLSERLDPEQA